MTPSDKLAADAKLTESDSLRPTWTSGYLAVSSASLPGSPNVLSERMSNVLAYCAGESLKNARSDAPSRASKTASLVTRGNGSSSACAADADAKLSASRVTPKAISLSKNFTTTPCRPLASLPERAPASDCTPDRLREQHFDFDARKGAGPPRMPPGWTSGWPGRPGSRPAFVACMAGRAS